MRRFQNRVIAKRRLLGASPFLVGSAEVAFFTGAGQRTVQYWLKIWQEGPLAGRIAKRDGNGTWLVSTKGLIFWLISRGRLRLGREYGYPNRAAAGRQLLELPPARFWSSTADKPTSGQP